MKNVLLPFLLATILCCQAAPILVEEAKDHIGENASVRGLVEQVSFSKKGNAFLDGTVNLSEAGYSAVPTSLA
jgi:hypothetical protein